MILAGVFRLCTFITDCFPREPGRSLFRQISEVGPLVRDARNNAKAMDNGSGALGDSPIPVK